MKSFYSSFCRIFQVMSVSEYIRVHYFQVPGASSLSTSISKRVQGWTGLTKLLKNLQRISVLPFPSSNISQVPKRKAGERSYAPVDLPKQQETGKGCVHLKHINWVYYQWKTFQLTLNLLCNLVLTV